MIQSLLDGKAPSQATSGSTSSGSTALKKKIIKKIEGNTMTLTGEPFFYHKNGLSWLVLGSFGEDIYIYI